MEYLIYSDFSTITLFTTFIAIFVLTLIVLKDELHKIVKILCYAASVFCLLSIIQSIGYIFFHLGSISLEQLQNLFLIGYLYRF